MRRIHAIGLATVVALAVGCSNGRHGGGGTGGVPAPSISAINPNFGPDTGGTAVTISGASFQSGATVSIAGAAATSVAVASSTTITAVTGSGMGGTDVVVVTNPDGQSATLLNGFATYATSPAAPTLTAVSPAAGPATGGQTVTLAGTGFQTGATVTVGGAAATGVSVTSTTSLTCTTPSGTAGAVAVVLTNPDTQSATLAGGYTYQAAPTVTGVSPSSGDVAGGTPVTVSGADFAAGAAVQLGGNAASGVTVLSPSSLTCATPAGATGAVSVTVTNPSGLSGTLASGFTYTSGGSAPTVSSVSPASGPPAGGTPITIGGGGFQTGATVAIGGAAATSVNVAGSGTITAVTPPAPPGATGALAVTVTNPGGAAASLAAAFTYVGGPVESSSDSAADPDAAIDGSGRIHVVWQRTTSTATDIVTARSTDGGVTWTSSPVVLDATTSPVSRPRVAARGNDVVVVWNEGNVPWHADSTDGGATWGTSAAIANSSGPGPTPSGFGFGGTVPDPDVAIDANGAVVVAGRGTSLAPQGGSFVVTYVVRGTAGGTYSTPASVGYVQVGPPSVSADGNGGVVVTAACTQIVGWSQFAIGSPVFAPARDVWVSRSTDGGASWTPAQLVTTGGPNGVDSFDPAVAVAGSHAVLVWGVGTGSGAASTAILGSGSVDGGANWSTPATVAGGSSLVRERPVVAREGNGGVSVAWQAPGVGSALDVFTARTTDVGQSFAAGGNLSANAGASVAPAIAGGAGTFVWRVWADDTASPGTFDVLGR